MITKEELKALIALGDVGKTSADCLRFQAACIDVSNRLDAGEEIAPDLYEALDPKLSNALLYCLLGELVTAATEQIQRRTK